MKSIRFEEVQSLLDSGKQPEEIFEIIFPEKGGFRMVMLSSKCIYLDKNNKLLSNIWFDNGGDFWEGFGVVELNGKQNYIKPDGTLLSKQWFDVCHRFYNGLGQVKLNGKKNMIKPNGKLLFDKWFNNLDINAFKYLPIETDDGLFIVDDYHDQPRKLE